MKYLFILSVVIAIVIQAIFATFMKKVAVRKGYGDDIHAWAMCFWLGLFGGIYIIALPDLILQSQNQRIIELLKESRKEYD